MAVKRKKSAGRPEVVADVNGFELTCLVDPRPELSGFDPTGAVASLRSEGRQKVRAICDELGLSAGGEDRLLRVVCELIERRKGEKAPFARTAKEHAEEMEDIARLARQLADRVDRLPDNLKMILMVSCQQLVDECLPEDWQLRYQEGCGLVAPMEILWGGADRAVAAFGENLKGGGRKPVLDHHGWHVLDIWRAVENQDINPVRGSFLKLCDVIFDVAGFPSKAEGAVRYFIENLSFEVPESLDATMRMLDRIQAVDESATKKQRKNPPQKSHD